MTCNAASYKEGHTKYPLKPCTHWRQSWIQHGRLCWKSTVAETGDKSATKSTVADTVNFVGGVYGAKATRSPVCTGLYCVLLTHSPTCECDRWQTRVSRAMTSGYVSIYEWTLNIYTLYCIVSEREYKSYIDVSLTRRCDLNHLRRRRPSMTATQFGPLNATRITDGFTSQPDVLTMFHSVCESQHWSWCFHLDLWTGTRGRLST